jgi:hypothetical protein
VKRNSALLEHDADSTAHGIDGMRRQTVLGTLGTISIDEARIFLRVDGKPASGRDPKARRADAAEALVAAYVASGFVSASGISLISMITPRSRFVPRYRVGTWRASQPCSASRRSTAQGGVQGCQFGRGCWSPCDGQGARARHVVHPLRTCA